jgi:hypothetical protein
MPAIDGRPPVVSRWQTLKGGPRRQPPHQIGQSLLSQVGVLV